MAHVFDDAILESTTSSGTGALTLAAVTGYKRFSQAVDVFRNVAIAVNDTVPYAVWAVDATGARTGDWEVGIGTYSATNTLTRTTVLESSNSGAAVSFASATTKYVSLTPIASKLPQFDNVGAMLIPGASAEPGTPPASHLYLYTREIVPGYMPLRHKNPSGEDQTIQVSLAFNGYRKWVGNGGDMVVEGARVLTGSAAGAAVTPASGTAASQVTRTLYATSATANTLITHNSPTDSNAHVFRGAVAGQGGFLYTHRMNIAALQTGNRGFWGLAATRTAATSAFDPLATAAPARVGIGYNINTGNWRLIWSDGTTMGQTDLGTNFPLNTTDLIELVLYCRPYTASTGNIGWRVRRFTTNADIHAFEASGTLSANQPAATSLIHPWWTLCNVAAAIASWHFNTASLQSDW